ncbi:MAG TPA: SRPBCC family protein [Burkholderiaceae bacterium]
MKILKVLLILIVGLFACLAVGGMFINSKYSVTRSIDIKATPDKVYALVAAPKAWKQWSVWNQRDPNMAISYSGPDSGVGAVWEWKSKSEGDGRMTMTAAEPGKRVAMDLYFPDWDSTSPGEISFSVNGDMTHVEWSMSADTGKNPLMHWFALLGPGMIAPDFDAGLKNLKTLAEKP